MKDFLIISKRQIAELEVDINKTIWDLDAKHTRVAKCPILSVGDKLVATLWFDTNPNYKTGNPTLLKIVAEPFITDATNSLQKAIDELKAQGNIIKVVPNLCHDDHLMYFIWYYKDLGKGAKQ